MANRRKKTTPELETVGESCEVGTSTALATEDMAPPEESIPTYEERLCTLEKKLAEQNTLLNRQAAIICQASENATELKKSREKCERLKLRAEDCKRTASEAKKAHEAAVEDHFALEKDLNSDQQKLPFPPPEEAPSPANHGGDEPGKTANGDDESWRTYPTSGLDLPESIVERLIESGLSTVGQLADWLKPNAAGYCRKLVDIDGIGQAKAERIETALDGFWQSRAQLEAEDANQEILAGVREVEGGQEAEDGPEWEDDDEPADDFVGSPIGEPEQEDDDLDDEPEHEA